MNKKKILIWFALAGASLGLEGFGPKTLFTTRSQALNVSQQTAGWQHLIYRPDLENTGATIGATPEYMHSFRPDEISHFLMGCRELTFSGSQSPYRQAADIMADYFGLPSDFRSVVQFEPSIVNFVMNFNFNINLDGWAPGLYFRVHAPIVHSKWDLLMRECVVDQGTTFTSYPAGYLAADSIELSSLTVGETAPKNVKTAFQGNAVFGDMREPLQYGKIFGRLYETRISELWLIAGYNFLLSDWYHAGVSLRVAAPTGTLRKSEFLFEPIAGNDHHWEVGGAFTGHVDLWSNEQEDKALGLYLDGQVTHLVASTQKRSFDLKNNGCGSRYMLLQKMAAPVVGLHNGLAPNNVAAPIQYQGRLVPAINKTTVDATISIGVQADVVAQLNFRRRGFNCSLGYNLWYRSAEDLKSRDCIEECYAIKGDAQLYGFTDPSETPVALAATQSNATINGGQPVTSSLFPNQDDGNFNTGREFANINADSIINAADTLGTALDQLTSGDAARLGVTQQDVWTSNPAVLLTNCDLDDCSALLPRALSHTIFFSFNYALERESLSLVPFIGGGWFVELAHADPCDNSAHAQWGIWLNMALSFNS